MSAAPCPLCGGIKWREARQPHLFQSSGVAVRHGRRRLGRRHTHQQHSFFSEILSGIKEHTANTERTRRNPLARVGVVQTRPRPAPGVVLPGAGHRFLQRGQDRSRKRTLELRAGCPARNIPLTQKSKTRHPREAPAGRKKSKSRPNQCLVLFAASAKYRSFSLPPTFSPCRYVERRRKSRATTTIALPPPSHGTHPRNDVRVAHDKRGARTFGRRCRRKKKKTRNQRACARPPESKPCHHDAAGNTNTQKAHRAASKNAKCMRHTSCAPC